MHILIPFTLKSEEIENRQYIYARKEFCNYRADILGKQAVQERDRCAHISGHELSCRARRRGRIICAHDGMAAENEEGERCKALR